MKTNLKDKIQLMQGLEILLENINYLNTGLCGLNHYLYCNREELTAIQYVLIDEFLQPKKPKGYYLFRIGEKAPRIQFLNKHIKKLKLQIAFLIIKERFLK